MGVIPRSRWRFTPNLQANRICKPTGQRRPPHQPNAPMSIRVQSPHFVVEQLEDGWMVETSHVTKDNKGDWMMDHDELVELADLLKRALES